MEHNLSQVAEAIRSVQQHVVWQRGSAIRHLAKRKRRGHLPEHATIWEYEQIIRSVVTDGSVIVYLYYHGDTPYVVVVATIADKYWLVMFGLDGVLESAYVLDRLHLYLNRPIFERVGTLEEVLS